MITDLPDEHVFTLDDSKAVRSALVQHVYERKAPFHAPRLFHVQSARSLRLQVCAHVQARMYMRCEQTSCVYIIYISVCMYPHNLLQHSNVATPSPPTC